MIRKGYGYPSVFNTDEVIMEQLRTGKTIEDARQGGCSGCIETDSLSAINKHVFEENQISMQQLPAALHDNFKDQEALRLRLFNKTPFYGNDQESADSIMQRVYESMFNAIDGKPNTKGSSYHLNMLSTTCHIYFGKKLGASANGRRAAMPISDGTSPSHGADRNGPTAVIKSLSKMDQIRSGGTLLNQRFLTQRA